MLDQKKKQVPNFSDAFCHKDCKRNEKMNEVDQIGI
jgi:hypothetical protein